MGNAPRHDLIYFRSLRVLQFDSQRRSLTATDNMRLKRNTTVDFRRSPDKSISSDLNEVFPYKVCINLNRRVERWQLMQRKFDHHGIQGVRRFSAVDGQQTIVPPNWSDTPGAYGCLLSHLKVVSEARALGVPAVLIVEDDAAFAEHLQVDFSSYFEQVPSDWDMLHFGAMHMDAPLQISKNVVKIRRANSTFAYALKSTVFDSFIELNRKASTAVDLNNHTLQAAHSCYCFTPHLAWVENEISDAQARQKYHWYLKESLVIHGSSMDDLLDQTSVIIAYQNSNRNDLVLQNLLFLTRFYRERLRGIRIVVVEQDTAPTLTVIASSEEWQYLPLRKQGPLDRAACFNTGMGLLDDRRSFLIFSDSDIFVEEWDIRGNLRMCEQYDGATGFKSMVNLTNAATLQLHRSKPMILTPWFNADDYSRSEKKDEFGRYCVFNRQCIEGAGGWEEGQPADDLSLKAGNDRRVFQSPNDALRLGYD
jgi:GR25 family glycosyltransferase involved in LPS biosynthesis